MRAWVYVPTGETTNNPAITPSTRTEVDCETIEALLDKLATDAPEGTRVVAFYPGSTRHFRLTWHGWEQELEVVVG